MRDLPVRLLSPALLARFMGVGAVGALTENLVLVALVETATLSPVPGAALSKEVSIAVMFLLNDRWTFAERGRAGVVPALKRFLHSNVVRAGGALVGLAVLAALHRWLGVWYLPANLVGIGVGFAFNFTFEQLVTWRRA